LAEIERQYRRFTGEQRNFADVVHDCKRLILRFSMSSELQMLAHRINRISEQHRKSRDFTLNALRYALREVLAAFSVYRTYLGPHGVSERDQRFVNRAVAIAKRRNRAMDPTTYDFIRDVLLLRHPPGLSAEAVRQREEFAGRFQQVTSPTMAKGVEDTAFYVFFPLLSANEVGSSPAAPVVKTSAFHQQNLHRSRRQRRGLLATTTHDTKRSEDVRARINVLTEIPEGWRRAVTSWSRLTRRWRTEVDGALAPSREDEYLFYQSLVGVWPAGEVDDAAHAALVTRMQTYMEKATHEAKQRTSWINPHAEYDHAVRHFVAQCLDRARENRFLAAFQPFHRSIAVAGTYTALSQTILKLTSPGVPDIYQGQELWDSSLVDPDNRRPVDYVRGAALLEQVTAVWNTQTEPRHEFAAALARSPDDERLKMFITWRLLSLRRDRNRLFAEGRYLPLEAQGSRAEHLVTFAWNDGADAAERTQLIVVVPRWWAKLSETAGLNELTEIMNQAEQAWDDTELLLPASATGRYVDVFSDQAHTLGDAPLRMCDALRCFPAAVLLREEELP
jgi:(1->4)-alpha-D-glucan 1-alpha-D-glucosylmutase